MLKGGSPLLYCDLPNRVRFGIRLFGCELESWEMAKSRAVGIPLEIKTDGEYRIRVRTTTRRKRIGIFEYYHAAAAAQSALECLSDGLLLIPYVRRKRSQDADLSVPLLNRGIISNNRERDTSNLIKAIISTCMHRGAEFLF